MWTPPLLCKHCTRAAWGETGLIEAALGSRELCKLSWAVAVRLQVHWFGLVNAFLVVVILVAVVSVILLRTLRKDFARYAAADDELEALERDVSEETGWKLVHGDVFRPPQ